MAALAMLANLNPKDIVGRLALSDALDEAGGSSLTVKLLRATKLPIRVVSPARYERIVLPGIKVYDEYGWYGEGQLAHGWVNCRWKGVSCGGAYLHVGRGVVTPYTRNEMCAPDRPDAEFFLSRFGLDLDDDEVNDLIERIMIASCDVGKAILCFIARLM